MINLCFTPKEAMSQNLSLSEVCPRVHTKMSIENSCLIKLVRMFKKISFKGIKNIYSACDDDEKCE